MKADRAHRIPSFERLDDNRPHDPVFLPSADEVYGRHDRVEQANWTTPPHARQAKFSVSGHALLPFPLRAGVRASLWIIRRATRRNGTARAGRLLLAPEGVCMRLGPLLSLLLGLMPPALPAAEPAGQGA